MEGNPEESNEEARIKRKGSKGGSVPRSLSASDGNNTREMAIRRMSSQANGGLSRNADSSLELTMGVALKRGMVLPFTPLAMSFDDIKYYVDMPAVSFILFHLCFYFLITVRGNW
ncbi:ABC transporter G family member 36-like [Magnolia sinica]|uniref:ABC transporter G family member 36-like n=1 Tax=Magnolia sinica TaxID=86752 RepID=UPI002657FBAF|nr:ABC transporter G family member 36-like [Magnolia sinica]